MKSNTQTLLDKVRALPPDRIAELENFVDSLFPLPSQPMVAKRRPR
uniref:DUF2281 domain-containing protein n=1 Tax=Candidatus Kentrum sp. FM TaxID=2126340 RepID=A0A450SYF9_9GAMM|nr:MAG: hypothetical protein BECKFM1743C_GA0114222_101675 [Candidatus Kentron sp. FM]VFJ59243.1 MAG: hypothetical protein BECKFM1743A_GA0114220_102332 [Candidatus Kentron sp. FM]VFK11213.1 MAG: hypothetical protein BECKFM1743B_GA0114221_101722 [Candidatus Kentron sp. FM]